MLDPKKYDERTGLDWHERLRKNYMPAEYVHGEGRYQMFVSRSCVGRSCRPHRRCLATSPLHASRNYTMCKSLPVFSALQDAFTAKYWQRKWEAKAVSAFCCMFRTSRRCGLAILGRAPPVRISMNSQRRSRPVAQCPHQPLLLQHPESNTISGMTGSLEHFNKATVGVPAILAGAQPKAQ